MTTTILLPLADELPIASVFYGALALAKPLQSHIHAAYVRPDPDTAISMLPEVIVAAGVTREEIARGGRASAAAAKDQFDKLLRASGIPAMADNRVDEWAAKWSEYIGDVEPVVTRFGRISDFIVLPRPAAGQVITQRCVDAAVFGSGRPTLLVGEVLPPNLLDHIMIAWNGSLEASRAVFGAMPLLRHAKRISIFTALEYGDDDVDLHDLAASFSERRIRTPEVVFPTDERSTGVALVIAAEKHAATLIVMGAYTHSRLRESFLGGVTKHLLAHAPVPLLMSH
jgi:nucleotide-binding universal stress UspA family protein